MSTINPEVKRQIIERIRQGGVSVADVAKEHGIGKSTINYWLAKDVSAPHSAAEHAKLRRENQMLLEIIGRLTVELSVEKKKAVGV